MPKAYEVLERSFINGRLYEKGDTVVLEVDSPGGNLKPFKADPKTKAEKADPKATDDADLPDA
ncbi:hypothetical protein D9M71_116880 [compost metagenome]